MTNAAPQACFWREAIDTADLAPPLAGRVEADVALVGGGYTSLVTAYYLARTRPELRIVLLERDDVGFGASGRNAGMVLHELHLDAARRHGEQAVRFTYEQAARAPELIAQLAREAGFDCDLDPTGYFLIGFNAAHRRRLLRMEREYRAVGVPPTFLDREAILAAIRSPRFTSALEFPGAAMLHPGKYVSGLKRAVRALGVAVHEHSPVMAVRDDREIEVATDAGLVQASHVVIGLNAYLSDARLSVVPEHAVTLSSFILLTEPLGDEIWRELGWAGRQGYSDARRLHNYVRPVGRRVLFGGRVAYRFGGGEAADVERMYTRLRAEMIRTFPCLAKAAITHRWHGPVAITPRRMPVIGRAGRTGRILYAAGYSGMGVGLATLAGRVLADFILGDEGRWRDLLYVRDAPPVLPPEPWRRLGFLAEYWRMRAADEVDRLIGWAG